jgi:hypothetical protein
MVPGRHRTYNPDMRQLWASYLLVVQSATLACGDDPADFTGSYTINVTNRANDCGFDNWMEGDTASNITMTITQATASSMPSYPVTFSKAICATSQRPTATPTALPSRVAQMSRTSTAPARPASSSQTGVALRGPD